ncbi:MAG: hypothetical protein RL377_58 [Bacteroidota bacterium]
MKKRIEQLAWTILLVIPLSIMGQKDFSKEKSKLDALGISVDANLRITNSQANRIMFVWDSIYDIGKKQQINYVLNDSIWEQLIIQEISRAQQKNQAQLKTRLHYYLAHIYHSRKLYTKSIPIQLQLIKVKQYLTKQQLQKTYTKIEKAYVLTNQLNKALAIRKLRLSFGMTEGSYDLYQDFELHELALKDFLLYEHLKNYKKEVDQYRYYKILGNLYFELGKIDSARKYFTIGLNISDQQIQNPDKKTPLNLHTSGKASFLGLLGKCYLAEHQYKKAIEYLLIDIEQSDDDKNNKLFKMIHLANAYIGNKELKNTKSSIRKIEQLTKDKEDKRIALRMNEMKSNYFLLANQLDSALFYLNLYNAQKDTHNEIIRKNQAILLLSNIEAEARKKDLILTKAKLDKERADKKAQLVFLWGSIIVIIMAGISLIVLFINYIQKSKSKQLIESKNEENELLLKELHHRVKNNLQVIYSLINLQKRRLDSPELHQSLSMVQNRIKTMSLVHQNLHENDNFKEVNLASYIKTISDYLKSLYFREEKEISIQLDIENSIELSMDKAITIGLLINEILSNSLKYAFKGKSEGSITIDVQKLHSGIQMKIQDNGIGFIPDQHNSKSLGLYLIENLVKQIQGRYELETFEGTTYLIYFNA